MVVSKTAKYTRNETSIRDKTIDSYEIQNKSISRSNMKMKMITIKFNPGERIKSLVDPILIGAILTDPFVLSGEGTTDLTTGISAAQFNNTTGTAKVTLMSAATGYITIIGYAILSKDVTI